MVRDQICNRPSIQVATDLKVTKSMGKSQQESNVTHYNDTTILKCLSKRTDLVSIAWYMEFDALTMLGTTELSSCNSSCRLPSCSCRRRTGRGILPAKIVGFRNQI